MTMTDASQMNDPQVVMTLETLRKLSEEIKQIDSQLGDTGGVIAQRNRIANELISQHLVSDKDAEGKEQNRAVAFISQAVAAIASIAGENDELMVAVYRDLENQLDKNYQERANKFLQDRVDSLPKTDKAELTDAQKQELVTQRNNKAQLFKLQHQMLPYYGVTTLPSDIEVPSVRRGAVGKRVSLNKEFQFYVDGKLKQFTDQDTGIKTNYKLSNIATNVVKQSLNWGTTELRDFIVKNTQGASVSEDGSTVTLPDEWEVTLPEPANVKLRGVAITVTNTDASVDDSDDDDDDNGSEAEGTSDFQM